jgi:hypothetical protein
MGSFEHTPGTVLINDLLVLAIVFRQRAIAGAGPRPAAARHVVERTAGGDDG